MSEQNANPQDKPCTSSSALHQIFVLFSFSISPTTTIYLTVLLQYCYIRQHKLTTCFETSEIQQNEKQTF